MTWVGPETITSLIEAHGAYPTSVLRPSWQGEPGWPVLVPLEDLPALRAIGPDRMPPEVIEALVAMVESRTLEVGDPGVVHDVETAPEDLPAYQGPPEPLAAHTHEWGADVAAEAGLPEP
jgi:CTP:molybdopterin cytidylyltransferase MocA